MGSLFKETKETNTTTNNTQSGSTANNFFSDPRFQQFIAGFSSSAGDASGANVDPNAYTDQAGQQQGGVAASVAPGMAAANNAAAGTTYNAQSYQPYMSEYTGQVTDALKTQYGDVMKQAGQIANGDLTKQGAFGNSNNNVARANAIAPIANQLGTKLAEVQQQGFNTANQNAQAAGNFTLQGANAAGQLANAQTGANTALGNIGNAQFGQQVQAAMLPGQVQNQFLQGYGQIGNLAGTNYTGQSTGNSNSETTESPSPFSSIMGVLGTGASLFGGNKKADGGRVVGEEQSYADGGEVINLDPLLEGYFLNQQQRQGRAKGGEVEELGLPVMPSPLSNFNDSGEWVPPDDLRELSDARQYGPQDPRASWAGQAKAIAANAIDPFHVPSWALGKVSPEAGEAWREAQDSGPGPGQVIGELMAPLGPYGAALKTSGEIIRAAPKTMGTAIAGTGLVAGASEAGDPFSPEIAASRLGQIDTRLKEIRTESLGRSKDKTLSKERTTLLNEAAEREQLRLEGERERINAGLMAFKGKEAQKAAQELADKAAAENANNTPFSQRHPYLTAASVAIPTAIAAMKFRGFANGRTAAIEDVQKALSNPGLAPSERAALISEQSALKQTLPSGLMEQFTERIPYAAAGAAATSVGKAGGDLYDILAMPDGGAKEAARSRYAPFNKDGELDLSGIRKNVAEMGARAAFPIAALGASPLYTRLPSATALAKMNAGTGKEMADTAADIAGNTARLRRTDLEDFADLSNNIVKGATVSQSERNALQQLRTGLPPMDPAALDRASVPRVGAGPVSPIVSDAPKQVGFDKLPAWSPIDDAKEARRLSSQPMERLQPPKLSEALSSQPANSSGPPARWANHELPEGKKWVGYGTNIIDDKTKKFESHAVAKPKSKPSASLADKSKEKIDHKGDGRWSGGTVQRYANGGRTSYEAAKAINEPVIVGGVVGHTGGRTDAKPVSVPSGSFVVPADVVGSLGEGNSLAGIKKLEQMFGKPNAATYARGGSANAVPIKISDGEFVLSPEQVAKLGSGDVDQGHRILDKLVLKLRNDHIKTLKSLPGPAQS